MVDFLLFCYIAWVSLAGLLLLLNLLAPMQNFTFLLRAHNTKHRRNVGFASRSNRELNTLIGTHLHTDFAQIGETRFVFVCVILCERFLGVGCWGFAEEMQITFVLILHR